MHTIVNRPPTQKEQQAIASTASAMRALGEYGCLLVLAAGPALFLADAGCWLGEFISPDAGEYGRWIGWAGAAALFIVMLFGFAPSIWQDRKIAHADLNAQIVQDIHVTNPRAVEVMLVGNLGPNVALEIGEQSILYLQGQWLYNCDIYGAPSPESDEGDKLFNGLPAPHSFPCTEFTITRLPNSGEVLQIQVAGEYLPPEPAVEALKLEHRFRSSELFCGSLQDIARIMDSEHQNRTASEVV